MQLIQPVVLPLSHSSSGTNKPSPHIFLHFDNDFNLFIQVYPLSRVQFVQPVKFPLSHSSPG